MPNVNKTSVLITGCSSGIGKALARECHTRGLDVIATARKLEKLDDLKALGIRCIKLDVNSQEDIESLKNNFNNNSQVIDIIINNAGFGLMLPMTDIEMNTLQQQFQTNVFSIVAMTNAMLPFLRSSAQAKIVNIGSVSGVFTTPFAGAYCASKAALHSISDAYRMELKPFGIQVITVQPGAIASAFGDNASKVTEIELKQSSPYKNIEDSVRRRSRASQENPSSAEEFAASLMKQVLKKHPPANIRLGNGSLVLPLLPKIIPRKWLDSLLGKPFKINTLHRKPEIGKE